MADRLLTIKEAAEVLGRPVATLYDWRYRNTGPKSARLNGGKVYYRESDLEAWINSQFEGAPAR